MREAALLAGALFLAALILSCGAPASTPTPAPTPASLTPTQPPSAMPSPGASSTPPYGGATPTPAGAATLAPTARATPQVIASPTPARAATPTPTIRPVPTRRPTPTPVPAPADVSAPFSGLLMTADQFPVPGYKAGAAELLGAGTWRRQFDSDNAALRGYYWLVIDLFPISIAGDLQVEGRPCGGAPDEKVTELSAPAVGDAVKACVYERPDGNRTFNLYTAARNVGMTVQAATGSPGVTNVATVELMSSLASLQLEIIDRIAPPGVTSTALKYDGAASLLEGATFLSTTPAAGRVSYTGDDGRLTSVMAFPGLVDVWLSPGQSASAEDMESLAAYLGVKLAGQVPNIGLYVFQAPEGKEGQSIDVMKQIGLEAQPALAVFTQTNIEDASTPHPVQIDAPQVQLDDFKTRICVKDCDLPPDRQTYLALPVAPGFPYTTTTDPSRALTHGALVQYLRLGRVEGSDEPTLGLDIATNIGLTRQVNALLDLTLYTNLRLVMEAADNSLTTTVNLSLAPSCGGVEGCGAAAANELFLGNLERLVNVSRANEKVALVLAAGNDGANVSMPPSVKDDPAWSSIIRVGALYPNGEELVPTSNYSIDDDMLYVPVMHAMGAGGLGDEECVPCMGTSFAAPQVDYLVGEIARDRPDLTPAQLRQVLFDSDVSPRRTVDGPNGLRLQVRAIMDPYAVATLEAALGVARRLFPPQGPQLPGQTPTPGATFVPLGRRDFNRPLQFSGPIALPPARAGEHYEFWFCDPPPSSPAFFCGVNNTDDPVGGHPPYHFQYGRMGGFPPFGLTLNTNGLLAGKVHLAAARTSPYKFEVCIVDLDSKSICMPASLLVNAPAPPPTATPTATPTRAPAPTATPTAAPASASFTITSASCRYLRSTGPYDKEYEVLVTGTASGPVGALLVMPSLSGYIDLSWSSSWGDGSGASRYAERLSGQPANTAWQATLVIGGGPSKNVTVDGYVTVNNVKTPATSRALSCQSP